MVPHSFDLYLSSSFEKISSNCEFIWDFLQPLQILNGQNLCDYNMTNSTIIIKYLNAIKSAKYVDSKEH